MEYLLGFDLFFFFNWHQTYKKQLYTYIVGDKCVYIYIIHIHIHNSHIYIDFIDPYFPLFRRGRVIGCLALSLLDPPKA